MTEHPVQEEPPGSPGSRGQFPRIRRIHSNDARQPRSPLVTGGILLGGMIVAMILLYHFAFNGSSTMHRAVIDFSKSTERIEELSTLKSHFRFSVIVREESGNVIVRRLADQTESIGMDGIGAALFQDPTMFVELHGIATYGVHLAGLPSRMRQDDSTVHIPLPPVEVLDVKLVAADTRVIAKMKGMFRSSSNELLLEADHHGEGFVREYAESDTAARSAAAERVRSALSLLVEQGGKRAIFE